jgi:acyl-CoA reductase-like NAD-dependent aldehyde dehydrogenase
MKTDIAPQAESADALTDALIARNPSNGAELGRVARTPPATVSAMVVHGREAQARWASLSWDERRTRIERWWHALAGDAEGWADAIRDASGSESVGSASS